MFAPMKKQNPDISQMFNERVRKTVSCWIWDGTIMAVGYGCLRFGGRTGPLFLAHRLSYVLHKGRIKKGLCVLHRCDNRRCVNPKHLFLGTRTDNMLDKVRKGRQSFTPGQKGEKSPNAKLSEPDVRTIRRTYCYRKHSFGALAKEFSMSKRQIMRIVKQQSWKHLAF